MSFNKEPNSYSVMRFLVWIEEVKYDFLDMFIINVLIDYISLCLVESKCDEVSKIQLLIINKSTQPTLCAPPLSNFLRTQTFLNL